MPTILLPLLAGAALLVTRLAGSVAESPTGESVAVRVGSSCAETSRVARGFAGLRDFQRQKYGVTPPEQLRAYTQQVVVRDLLLAERGRRSAMMTSPRVQARHKVVLSEALSESLRARMERENPVTDADIKSYFDAHPEIFKTPARIRIQRLLVDSESEAQELLDRAKKLASMDDWRNLVREKSKDRATAERGGDLGFVAADGTTDVPELEVEKTLFAAVQGVKDGELVQQPVPEGKRFAVVWRRGSVAAKSMDLAHESPRIRQQLLYGRVERALNDLILQLRSEHLHEYRPERIAALEFPIRKRRDVTPPAVPHAAGELSADR